MTAIPDDYVRSCKPLPPYPESDIELRKALDQIYLDYQNMCLNIEAIREILE